MDERTRVVRNAEASRFEAWVEGELAGVAEFLADGDRTLTFTHTEVFPAFKGQGLATLLVEAALDEVRERGERIVPRCPFVRAYVEEHVEYQDLLAER